MQRSHVIIVNYNAGDWLARSVASALRYSDGKVSVVDNASTDDSVAKTQALLADARLQWLMNDCNIGFAAANNAILKHVQAEFAVLMNPDCELSSGVLDTIFDAFDQNPTLGLASCRINNRDGSIQSTCRRRFPTPWSSLVRLLQLHRLFPNNPKFVNFDYGDDYGDELDGSLSRTEIVEAISGAFMVARKSAIDDVGLLDEAYFMHCEDLDWCKRFALAHWQVGFVPSISVLHDKGVSSRSRPIAVLWTLHKGMNRFFDKFYRHDHSFVLRCIVKLGIAVSFVGRSSVTLMQRLFDR